MTQYKKKNTSWQKSAEWYDKIVGTEGHYYHRQIIFPNLLKRVDFANADVLDLACGQGILSRQIPENTPYLGLDLSKTLIDTAREHSASPRHIFGVADMTKPLDLEARHTHAFIILALQNMTAPLEALKNASEGLKIGGKLYLVLNHPCYRIPRHSAWQVDEARKIQQRTVDSYMSTMQIPIAMHPGKGKKSETTFSTHFSLHSLFGWLKEAGFVVSGLEEWCSDKESIGSKAKMENRARDEFPLFMLIEARKESAPQEKKPTAKSPASEKTKRRPHPPKRKSFPGKR
ncbi:MAG: class I SAM-dependent methyltransferase [Chlamydiia bacterium]|nr:class I SAM-dependent methyltransferase [Chlamydiia bacterium]